MSDQRNRGSIPVPKQAYEEAVACLTAWRLEEWELLFKCIQESKHQATLALALVALGAGALGMLEDGGVDVDRLMRDVAMRVQTAGQASP